MNEVKEKIKQVVEKGGFTNTQGVGVVVSTLVPWSTITNMMISFVESGDPVTRGWCCKVARGSGDADPGNPDPWYAQEKFWSQPDWTIRVTEFDDVPAGKGTIHRIRNDHFVAALRKLAAFDDKGSYRHHFDSIVKNDTDAATADIFMQMAVFGQEKYA